MPPAIDNSPLTPTELLALIRRVFRPGEEESRLAILTDLPDAALPDHPRWRARRALTAEWAVMLRQHSELAVCLVHYPNVRQNNADLPARAWPHQGGALPERAEELDPAAGRPFAEVLAAQDLILAPTELSTTAPLKLAARAHGFRAATMPGFDAEMTAALRLDYGEIDRRVRFLKEVVDAASGAAFRFRAEGEDHELFLDLRHRLAQASGGLVTERGTAGNLPSGETYIVPYEGERPGDPSRSRGVLPVEIGGEVVRFRVEENRAVEALGQGPAAAAEAEHLRREPAYGNLAELGLGVLGDFGLEPIGQILLDEKLGLHIAFGRSDHFGGRVGAGDFSRPEQVIHYDWVYLPRTQPRIEVASVDLELPGGGSTALMRGGAYVLDGLYQAAEAAPDG